MTSNPSSRGREGLPDRDCRRYDPRSDQQSPDNRGRRPRHRSGGILRRPLRSLRRHRRHPPARRAHRRLRHSHHRLPVPAAARHRPLHFGRRARRLDLHRLASRRCRYPPDQRAGPRHSLHPRCRRHHGLLPPRRRPVPRRTPPRVRPSQSRSERRQGSSRTDRFSSGGTVIAGLLFLLLDRSCLNQSARPRRRDRHRRGDARGLDLPARRTDDHRPSRVLALPSLRPQAETAKPKRGSGPASPRAVADHPRRIWVTLVIILAIPLLALPQFKAEGVPQSDFVLGDSEARDGQDILADEFPWAAPGPRHRIVVAKDELSDAAKAVGRLGGVESNDRRRERFPERDSVHRQGRRARTTARSPGSRRLGRVRAVGGVRSRPRPRSTARSCWRRP